MSEGGGKTYRPWEPQRYRQQAHSPASKLPDFLPYTFFLLNGDMALNKNRHIFVHNIR
jgi:hypothetical protein